VPATKTKKSAAKATKAKDEQAIALAAAARDLARASGLTSAYGAGEAREIINRFDVTRARGVLTIVKDGGEPQKIKAAVLSAFIAGEKNDATREAAKLMAALSGDLKGMLYGRKSACFIAAAA
jgi:hypothetical protein